MFSVTNNNPSYLLFNSAASYNHFPISLHTPHTVHSCIVQCIVVYTCILHQETITIYTVLHAPVLSTQAGEGGGCPGNSFPGLWTCYIWWEIREYVWEYGVVHLSAVFDNIQYADHFNIIFKSSKIWRSSSSVIQSRSLMKNSSAVL